MNGIAVVNSSQGSINIGGFVDSKPLSLTVSEPGLYLVFARVVLQNNDGDAQNASARISHDVAAFGPPQESLIDRVDARIPGNSRMSISLQGTLQVPTKTIAVLTTVVDLNCATFNGTAGQSSIFAVQISDLQFS